MKIKAGKFLPLVALGRNGRIESIQNHIQRKPMLMAKQSSMLGPNSMLITCNYCFNEESFQWSRNVVAVGHPFKNPVHFPDRLQLHLLSESDFCDKLTTYNEVDGADHGYDFVYYTIDSLQGIRCKGLHLLPAIDQAAQIAGLRGVVISYGPKIIPYKKPAPHSEEFHLTDCRKKMKKFKAIKVVHKNLDQRTMCLTTKGAKFVIFPNTRDASPRMIPETLLRNTPILVNRNIYGGWKYVNDKTGMFFDTPDMNEFNKHKWEDEFTHNLAVKMREMVESDFSKVEAAYYKEFGFVNTAKRLAGIFNKIQGSTFKMVCYADWRNLLDQVRRVKK